jgi:prepilin-type N-terminal cleavage/methylation domain-containing protein
VKKITRGFTLIELLVVIAIIGILAMIVIINVSVARGKAVNAHVLADVSTVDKTAIMCMVEGYYLYSNNTSRGVSWANNPPSPSFPSFSISVNDPICSATVYPDPYLSSDVTGIWPDFNSCGNSPDGTFWAPGALMTITPSPSFFFMAATVSEQYKINCTQNGCNHGTNW